MEWITSNIIQASAIDHDRKSKRGDHQLCDACNILVWCATDRSIWILRLTQLCDHLWLVLSESNNSSRAITFLLNDCTLISGSSELTQFLLACMRVRYGLLLSYNQVGRWITPYGNGFWHCQWQCQKGFSESETPLLLGALCENVAWSPCNSTAFALQCACAIQWEAAKIQPLLPFCKNGWRVRGKHYVHL